MRLSALNLPALVLLVTSNSGGLGASLHLSKEAALKDVVRELQADNDAPDDLEPETYAIADWIGNADIHYEFAIQPASFPGFRVVAYDRAAGVVLDQRLADTTDLEAAQNFAGMIWNQHGFGADDVAVYLYRFGGDEPVYTLQTDDGLTLDEARDAWNDDPTKATAKAYRDTARQYHADAMIEDDTLEQILAETAAYVTLGAVQTTAVEIGAGPALTEGERTAYFSERGQYWYVDEVQGGERVTIAKNLTQDQANTVQAGQQPFDGVTGELS